MTALSYRLFGSKVDHSEEIMFFKDFFEQISISNISLIDWKLMTKQRKKSVLNLIFVCV